MCRWLKLMTSRRDQEVAFHVLAVISLKSARPYLKNNRLSSSDLWHRGLCRSASSLDYSKPVMKFFWYREGVKLLQPRVTPGIRRDDYKPEGRGQDLAISARGTRV